MIIAINGRIGSGKDTFAKVLQYAIFMKKYSGTVSIPLMAFMNQSQKYAETVSGVQIKKYAAKLKEFAASMLGVNVEKFEDQEFKNSCLGEDWNYMTVRTFLQKLGTEAIRDGLHTNAWVNALFADYKNIYLTSAKDGKNPGELGNPLFPNWIITDCRFPNEAQAVKDRSGIVVRIQKELPQINYPTLEHISETSLDDWKFDETIENTGTIEDLLPKANDLLNKYNL